MVVLLAVFALPNRAWGSALGRIYWTDRGTNKIQCAGIDVPSGETPGSRSDIEDLVTAGVDYLHGIAIDSAAGKMYWAGDGKIRRADLDGSNVEDLVISTNALGIALDLTAGMMYWADEANWMIQRANMEIPSGQTPSNRTDIETLIPFQSVQQAWAIDVDPSGGKMYFNAFNGIHRERLT